MQWHWQVCEQTTPSRTSGARLHLVGATQPTISLQSCILQQVHIRRCVIQRRGIYLFKPDTG